MNEFPQEAPSSSKNTKTNSHLKIKTVSFLVIVLIFATFVSYPSQAAYGHESDDHQFCWQYTLTAFEYPTQIAFTSTVVAIIAASLGLIPKPAAEAISIPIKLALAIMAVFAGIALSTACNPEIAPPPKTSVTFLPCNYVEDPRITENPKKGYYFYATQWEDLKSFGNPNTFEHSGKFWESTDDDRVVDLPPNDEGTILVKKSWRDSMYTNSTPGQGTRQGFTTFYQIDSAYIWFALSQGMLISFAVGIFVSSEASFTVKGATIAWSTILELFLGLLIGFAVAFFGEYHQLIRNSDPDAGTIAHPATTKFEINRASSSAEEIFEGKVDSDPQKNIPPIMLWKLGQNHIEYSGTADFGAYTKTDGNNAKKFINVVDTMPPYLGFPEDNFVKLAWGKNSSTGKLFLGDSITNGTWNGIVRQLGENTTHGKAIVEIKNFKMDDFIEGPYDIFTEDSSWNAFSDGNEDDGATEVEANSHWGFTVREDQWHKMGYNEFFKYDDCSKENKVNYVDDSFIPLEKINGLKEAMWSIIDHPQGYDIYEAPVSLNTLLPTDTGDLADLYFEELFYQNVTGYVEALEDARRIDRIVRENVTNNSSPGLTAAEKLSSVINPVFQTWNKNNGEKFSDSTGIKFIPACLKLADTEYTAEVGAICAGAVVTNVAMIGADKYWQDAARKTQLKDWAENIAKDGTTMKKMQDDIVAKKAARQSLEDSLEGNSFQQLFDPDNQSLKSQAVGLSKDIDVLTKQIDELTEETSKISVKLKNTYSDVADAIGDRPLTKGDIAGPAFYALGVGIDALVAFAIPEPDPTPESFHLDGSERFYNQTVRVIDSTPPNVFQRDFVAIEVPVGGAVDGITIDHPLVFDSADPRPDLFHNFTLAMTSEQKLENNCWEKRGYEKVCGFARLTQDQLFLETLDSGVYHISWFATDYSGNVSDLEPMIVNVKEENTNQAPIAKNQIVYVGGYNYNPDEDRSSLVPNISVVSQNPDDDPVKYFLTQSPEKGVLISPFIIDFQSKLRKTGESGFINGLVSEKNDDLVFFPDGLNNRILKRYTNTGYVDFGFSIKDNPTLEVVGSSIIPNVITKSNPTPNPHACDYTYLVGDWFHQKIYEIVLENCDPVNDRYADVIEVYDIRGLFSDANYPKYFELDSDGDTLWFSDSGLESIIKTSLTSLSNPNSLKVPQDIVVSENGSLWVADAGYNRILKFNTIDNESMFGETWDTDHKPVGVTTNGTHVFVAHEGGDLISAINQVDNGITQIDNFGDVGNFTRIAINGTDFYTTDYVSDSIHKIDSSGNVESFGFSGTGDGMFDNPTGIAVNQTKLYVADTGNNRIVKINLDSSYFDDDYSNSTGEWTSFGSGVKVDNVLNFTNVNSDNFSGARIGLPDVLPNRSWSANFTLSTGTNYDDSDGYLWTLASQALATPPNEENSVSALGVVLDSSKLHVYEQISDSDPNFSLSTEGISIANNTDYKITFSRNTEEQTHLTVRNLDDDSLVGSFFYNVTGTIENLGILQHSNNSTTSGDILNFTIDDTVIFPVKYSWMGACSGGADCIDEISSDGFLCTDDTCYRNTTNGELQGQFDAPLGISVKDSSIFVTDSANRRIQEFDSNGNFIFSTTDDSLSIPSGVTTLEDSVYVSDIARNRIFKFDQNREKIGEIITRISQQKFLDENFQYLLGIGGIQASSVSMSNNDTWVFDNSKNLIINLGDNTMIGNVLEPVSLDSLGLVDPTYMTITGSGDFMIIDQNMNELVVFNVTNNSPNEIEAVSLGQFGIQSPVGIEIDVNANPEQIFISDWKQGEEKIIQIQKQSGVWTKAEEFSIPGISSNPQDIGLVNWPDVCKSYEGTSPPYSEILHCDSPPDTSRLAISDNDELGPKIIILPRDKGIISSLDLLNVVSIENGLDEQENKTYTLVGNGTIFSYDPWFSSSLDTVFTPQLDGFGAVNFDSFDFNPTPFGSKGIFVQHLGGQQSNSPANLSYPADMILSNGILYVTDFVNQGSVKIYNGTTGDYVDTIISENNNANPYGMAISPTTGHLFVGWSKLGCVKEYETESPYSFIKQWCKPNGQESPRGMAIDESGENLYVVDVNDNAITKYPLETFADGEIIPPEKIIQNKQDLSQDSPQLIDEPEGLLIDGDVLYVANTGKNNILKFNVNGDFIEIFANVTSPRDLYQDDQGEIYVTSNSDESTLNDSVEIFGIDGELIKKIELDIKSPAAIILDNQEDILVGSTLENLIKKYGNNYSDYYIASWEKEMIYAFSSEGIHQEDSDIDLSGLGIDEPGNLAIDKDGLLYVTNKNNGNKGIFVIDQINKSVKQFISLEDLKFSVECIPTDDEFCSLGGQEIATPDELSSLSITPNGISFDSNDQMFVSDEETKQIVMIPKSGEFYGSIFKLDSDTFDIAVSQELEPWKIYDDDQGEFVEPAGNGNENPFRFSVVAGQKIQSFNSLSIIQEFSDFAWDLESIDGLAGSDFAGMTLATSGLENVYPKIVLTNTNPNLNLQPPNGGMDTIVDFSMTPEGIAIYDNNDMIAVTDWERQSVRGYDITNGFTLTKDDILNNTKLGWREMSFESFNDIDIDKISNDEILFISDNDKNQIARVNLASGIELPELPVSNDLLWISDIEINQENEIYVLSGQNKTLAKYDENLRVQGEPIDLNNFPLLNNTSVTTSITGANHLSLSYPQSGEKLYVVLPADVEIKKTDFDSNVNMTANSTTPTTGNATHYAFPSSTYIISGTWDEFTAKTNLDVRLHLGDPQPLYIGNTNEIAKPVSPIGAFAVDPSGSYIFLSQNDDTGNSIIIKSSATPISSSECLLTLGNIYINCVNWNNDDILKSNVFAIGDLKSTSYVQDDVDLCGNNPSVLYGVDSKGSRVLKIRDGPSCPGSLPKIDWMGGCDGTSNDTLCNTIANATRGFSCELMVSDDVNIAGLQAQENSDCIMFEGDGAGQFNSPSAIALDANLGDLYVADRWNLTINGKLEEQQRIQKFNREGFFIEDFISSKSLGDQDFTDESAGFFERGYTTVMAKSANNFYAADPYRLHFFNTNPFFNEVVLDSFNHQAISNVTYGWFEEPATDSFMYKVWDGFDFSDLGIVDIHIDTNDCNDDGIGNSLQQNDANGCPIVSIDSPSSGIIMDGDSVLFEGTAFAINGDDISNNIAWKSSIDGELGTGSSILFTLTNGTHSIYAVIIDSSIEIFDSVDVKVGQEDGLSVQGTLWDSSFYSLLGELYNSVRGIEPKTLTYGTSYFLSYLTQFLNNNHTWSFPQAYGLPTDEEIEFSDGQTFGVVVNLPEHLKISDSPSPNGISITTESGFVGPAEIKMCNDLYTLTINFGDSVLVKCDPNEIMVVKSYGGIPVTFSDTDNRNASTILCSKDTVIFEPEIYSITSNSEISYCQKDVLVQHNGDEYTYTDVLTPNSVLVVDTTSPIFECPEGLSLEADVIFGVSRDFSKPSVKDSLDEFINHVYTESMDQDNGSPNRDESLNIIHDMPTDLPVGETLVSFNGTDGIGNFASCVQVIEVTDNTKPQIKLNIGSMDWVIPGSDPPQTMEVNFMFETPPHDDVFAFDFEEDILNDAEIWDRPLSWIDETTPGIFIPVMDPDNSVRRPVCNPTPGAEFSTQMLFTTSNRNPVPSTGVCQGLDEFANAGTSQFDVIVLPNSTGVVIDTATASGIESGITDGDWITIRFSHETNKPQVEKKSEIDNFIQINNGNLGQDYFGFFQNPSTLVIEIKDSTGASLNTDGTTTIELIPGIIRSASGILDSTSSIAPLYGSFELPRPPFITDFVANDPRSDILEESKTKEDFSNNFAYSVGDTFTIRFSDEVDITNYGSVMLDKEQIQEMFIFQPSDIGDDYVGAWLDDRTFQISIKEKFSGPEDPKIGTTTVMINQTSKTIKDKTGTVNASGSESWPLEGLFGRFLTRKTVDIGYSAVTTTPAGIPVEIKFPQGEYMAILSLADGVYPLSDSRQKIIGNVLNVGASEDACDEGCVLTFTLTDSDLKRYGARINDVFIFHDGENEPNRKIDKYDIIEDQITKNLGPGVYSKTAIVNSLSPIGLITGSHQGGGCNDCTAPKFQSISFSDGGGGFADTTIKDIQFNNDLQTIIAKTGKQFSIAVNLYENSGSSELAHVSLYMNLLGFDNMVHQSDTYVRWDKGFPVSVSDPHGYFLNADVEILEVGNQVQAVFTFNFAKPMETSDVIIRAWDLHRNSADANFPDLLTVTGDIISYFPDFEPVDYTDILDRGENFISVFPEGFLDKWAGYSEESISDAELLTHLGLEGNYIPQWFKDTTAKWYMDGKISEQEFVDALTYLSENNILYA